MKVPNDFPDMGGERGPDPDGDSAGMGDMGGSLGRGEGGRPVKLGRGEEGRPEKLGRGEAGRPEKR